MEKKEFITELLALVEQHEKIVILRHQNPDPDALGSQLGLKYLLEQAYPEKVIKAVGYMPQDFSYIGEMDTISETFFREALIIVTDTANTPRIDTPYELNADQVIKIDHHPNKDPYGRLLYVDDQASSCSEIIASFCFEDDSVLKMNDQAARVLYTGIIGDTGRFLYPATRSHTYEIVARLVQYQFTPSEIANHMMTRSLAVSRLAGYLYQHLEVSTEGVASIVLPQSLLKEYGVTDGDTSSLVGLPGTIEEVNCWGIFVEQPGGEKYRCRLRSKTVVINTIAEAHDGGGHPLASGANAYSLAEVEKIIEELKQAVRDSIKK